MKQIGSNLSGNGQTPNEPKTGLCPDCGKIVSKLASICPHCGRPLSNGDLEENPEYKAPIWRTAADEEKIRCARGESGGKQTSSAWIAIAVIVGIIVAVWILSKVLTVEVAGTIVPIR